MINDREKCLLNKMDPFFSIIIPVYNVEDYLEECLISVITQAYESCEVILIDDGSTDGSGEVCDRFAREHLGIKIYVIHQKNAGLSVARNVGIKMAQGKYILFLDSDDFIDTDTLEHFAQILKKNSVDILITTRNYEFSATKQAHIYPKEPSDITGNMNGIQYISAAVPSGLYQACAQYNIYSRRFLLKNNFQFEQGIYHEDELWSLQTLPSAQTVYVEDYPFYYHRMREGSITHLETPEKLQKRAQDIFYICEKLDGTFPKNQAYAWMRERIAHLYMSGAFLGGKDCLTKRKVDRFLPLRNAKSTRNRIKALIFMTSPKMYILLDKIRKKGVLCAM